MKLSEAIAESGFKKGIIEYRCNYPKKYKTELNSNDDSMLLGYCEYNGKKLKPLDGDSYHLSDEIKSYKILHDMLVVTTEVEWYGDK